MFVEEGKPLHDNGCVPKASYYDASRKISSLVLAQGVIEQVQQRCFQLMHRSLYVGMATQPVPFTAFVCHFVLTIA